MKNDDDEEVNENSYHDRVIKIMNKDSCEAHLVMNMNKSKPEGFDVEAESRSLSFCTGFLRFYRC